MKKLFLTIGIIALIIIMVAAVLALLSVFDLIAFFPQLAAHNRESYPEDQATILVAYVDSLDDRQFQVDEVWLVYIVTSRMDTAIIQQANEVDISPKRLRKVYTQTSLTRKFASEEDVDIDFVFLIDGMGKSLINNLLEDQQSSINLNESEAFCEILTSNEVQMFDLYLQYAEGHVLTTIPKSLIARFAANENLTDSLYCETNEP